MKMRGVAFLVSSLSLLSLITLSGCGGSSGSTTQGTVNSGPAAATQRVAIVVLENKPYAEVVGNALAPYMNQLAQQFGLATQYFANTHPSIGNYFMMTSGQIITNDDSFTGTVSDDNLAREITASGKQWKVYAQALPSAGYTGGDQYPYLRHHNPFSYFSDVLGSSAQADRIVPFTQLSADMGADTLPDFLFIVPDAQHDGHDCPVGMTTCTDNDEIAASDAWLQQNIAPLLASASFQDGILVITFDESADSDTEHGGGHVAAIVAGNPVQKGIQSGTLMQHENLLRFVCDRLQLGTCPGAGAGAASAMDAFLR
jgi:phosphatidylinositol-3-phosphatase